MNMTDLLLLGVIAVNLMQLGVSIYVLQQKETPMPQPLSLLSPSRPLSPEIKQEIRERLRHPGAGRELLRQRLAARAAEQKL